MLHNLRFLAIVAIVVATGTVAVAQAPGEYRSNVVALGNWSAVSTWEIFDGSEWVAASAPPGPTAYVTILSGDTISIDVRPSIAGLTLEAGCVVSQSVLSGLFNGDVVINGTWNVSGTANDTIAGNLTLSGPTAALKFASSGGHFTGVAGKVFTLSNGAFLQSSTNGITPGGDPFNNLVTNATWVIDNSAAMTTLASKNGGNTTIQPPPNGQIIGNLKFTTASGANNRTITLGANLTIAGNLSYDAVTSAQSPLYNTWNCAGFKITTTGTGKSVTVSQLANSQIIITGTSTELFSGFATYNFVSPANSNVHVKYASASGTQTVAPGTYQNLTVSGAGAKAMAGNVTVSDTLMLTNGVVSTGANTLTVGGPIVGGSSTSYVDGKLARVISTTGSRVFPIGASANYRPVTLDFTALTGTSTVTAQQFETALSGTIPPNTTLYSSRYWRLTESGGSGINYSLSLDGTGFSPLSTPVVLRSDAGTVTSYVAGASAPTYTAMGLTGFGDFGLGDWAPSSPTIVVISSLSPFVSAAGVPSAQQSYTVAGVALSGDITITPPANFEISATSGSGFGTSPITLTQTGGKVNSTTIYVRMNSPTAGTPSGNIAHTSSGATQQNVAVSGTVNAVVPSITATGSLAPFTSAGGIPSAEQTYTVSGSNMLSNLLITAPVDFQVSTVGGGVGFGQSVTLTQSGGTIGTTTVYVRLYRPTPGTPSGNIVHSTTGAPDQNLAVGGTVTTAPTITSTPTGGKWSASTTWVGGYIPSSGNPVVIADGALVTIDTNVVVPSLTVGIGPGTGATLAFDGAAIRSLAVTGNVEVRVGDTLRTQYSGSFINQMYIGGNLLNNGTFEMFPGASSSRNTAVTFNKTDGDQTISGSAAVTSFRGITVNKGSVAGKVTASMNVTNGGGTDLLSLPNGTWEQSAGTFTVLGSSQTIGATGALVISGTGSFNMAIPSNLTVWGSLTVNTTGTVAVGTGAGKIDFAGAGAVGNFVAGTIDVGGKVNVSAGANLTISGGNIIIDPQRTLVLPNTDNTFAVSSTGILTWTGGTVTIADANGGTGVGGGRDISFTAGTAPGGVFMSGTATLVLGDGTCTTSYDDLKINCNVANTLQNLTINTNSVACKTISSGLTVKGILTLTSGTLNIGAQTLNGVVSNVTTTCGLYNPIVGTPGNLRQVLATTGGPLSSMKIQGTVLGVNVPANINRLARLTIDNPNGTTLQGNLLVDTTLTLTNGGLILNGNALTYGPGATLVYNGLTAQTTNNIEFPASGGPTNLTASNTASVALHASRTIAGMLRVTSGSLNVPYPANKITLNDSLVEAAGSTVVGAVEATRNVEVGILQKFGGIGVDITAAGVAPGATTVTRVTGVVSSAGTGSIKRYFDITPTTNAGLNATLVFRYDTLEVGSVAEESLVLHKSTNAGSTWASAGGVVDAVANTITLAGVNDLSRWTAVGATTTTTLNVPLASGWNLISNPVTGPVPGDSVRQLYPTSTNTYVFEYSGGYQQRYLMANGKGYWGKFPAAISNSITGTPRTRDSLAVVTGWNIVGSISSVVDTNTIVSVPPGLRTSSWFGYLGGYTAVTQLVPGKGYWVKSTGAGKFFLGTAPGKVQAAPSTPLAEILNTLTITDSKGGSQTLYFGGEGDDQLPGAMYVMPPVPPTGAFDARFSTVEGGTMVQRHPAKVTGAVEFPVAIQSDAYPLTVTWSVSKGTASYELTDGRGGEYFRAREMTGEGSMKITNGELAKISVRLVGDGQLPTEYALSQNYPNPFNPSTSIKYALPIESRVTVEIYNLLGQRVRNLIGEAQAAGYHTAEWDGRSDVGATLPSGVYFLRLGASGNDGRNFAEVRKLMMVK